MKRHGARTVAAAALAALVAAAGHAENWPMFRGPSGLGHSREKNLPVHWGGKDKANVAWTAPLAGEGHASPIVWDGRVFVSTVAWADSVPDRKKVIPDHHLLCWRASDGQRLWDRTIPPGRGVRTDCRSGPGGGYAAPTPASKISRTICMFVSPRRNGLRGFSGESGK